MTTVYRVFVSTYNGEETRAIYSDRERAVAHRDRLNARFAEAGDSHWYEACVDAHELDVEGEGVDIEAPQTNTAQVFSAVRDEIESVLGGPVVTTEPTGPMTFRITTRIPVVAQEPMPDPRVAFVLRLLERGDLHSDTCSDCAERIAEAAGVPVEEVLAEWRRIEDGPGEVVVEPEPLVLLVGNVSPFCPPRCPACDGIIESWRLEHIGGHDASVTYQPCGHTKKATP